MHNIKRIRENPDEFDLAMKRRGVQDISSSALLEIDEKYRHLLTQIQGWQSERNSLSQDIGKIKKEGGNADDIIQKVGTLKDNIASAEEQSEQLKSELDKYLVSLPNYFDADVPDGESDEENVVLEVVGEPTQFDFEPKDHVDLGTDLGFLDMEVGAKMSGARFYVTKSGLAHLERALQQYCLDVNTKEFGYVEVNVPFLVKEHTMIGTGQLPKFGEDLFKTDNGYWLIPTGEVPITNLVRESILSEAELPLRFTGLTPSFRSEAGSAGKDTRGMIRLHQFWKVELVSITTPEQSEAEFKRMVEIEETLFQRIGIPYRKIIQCTGDTGFGSLKTYDLEGWFPGQDTYRELTSCSNFGDFQARRMNARYRPGDDKSKSTEFVHTLNGSALSTTRFMVALMENFQNADGSISVPEVLQPYMGGQTKIEAEN